MPIRRHAIALLLTALATWPATADALGTVLGLTVEAARDRLCAVGTNGLEDAARQQRRIGLADGGIATTDAVGGGALQLPANSHVGHRLPAGRIDDGRRPPWQPVIVAVPLRG